jgi:hypothetical protein
MHRGYLHKGTLVYVYMQMQTNEERYVIGNLPKGVAMIGSCSAELQNKEIVKQCASSIVVVECDFNNGFTTK